MGLAIFVFAIWCVSLGCMIFAKKKYGNEAVIFAFGFLVILIATFLSCQVFPKYGEPKLIDTLELDYITQSKTFYVEEEQRKLTENNVNVNVKITYELLVNSEDLGYVFHDDEGYIYYIADEQMIIKTVKALAKNEEGTTVPVEVVKGEYESVYLEKYEKEAPVTFWSMGGTKQEYKVYIPE